MPISGRAVPVTVPSPESMLGDWGVHLIDIVQLALDTPGLRVVTCVGQKLALKDNCDSPDTQHATFDYPEFVCSYEYRSANANSMFGKGYGILFLGTEPTMFLNRQGFEVILETRKGRDDKDVARSASMKMDEVDNGLENHAANMLECMKTRKRPACDIEDGLRSSSTSLLGVVALRTGERLEFDAAKQELKNPSSAATKLFGREYRAPWRLS
jgi:predicted dehydrogenase